MAAVRIRQHQGTEQLLGHRVQQLFQDSAACRRDVYPLVPETIPTNPLAIDVGEQRVLFTWAYQRFNRLEGHLEKLPPLH